MSSQNLLAVCGEELFKQNNSCDILKYPDRPHLIVAFELLSTNRIDQKSQELTNTLNVLNEGITQDTVRMHKTECITSRGSDRNFVCKVLDMKANKTKVSLIDQQWTR